MGAFDGERTRMRETLEALMMEHITEERYAELRREAVDEVRDTLPEGETAIPLGEVRQIVTRRVLLLLASVTTGEVSHAMQRVARQFGH
jgi:hypothetical protein